MHRVDDHPSPSADKCPLRPPGRQMEWEGALLLVKRATQSSNPIIRPMQLPNVFLFCTTCASTISQMVDGLHRWRQLLAQRRHLLWQRPPSIWRSFTRPLNKPARNCSTTRKVDRKNGSRLFRRHSDSVRFALVAGGGCTLQKVGALQL